MGDIEPYDVVQSRFLPSPLSGFLGGRERGGKQVVALEDKWAKTFEVSHAVAMNSATSGLYALAVVLGLKHVYTTPFTMSATAAAPMNAGAKIHFCDIEPGTYGIDPESLDKLLGPDIALYAGAVYVTNLFGHPARLTELKAICDREGIPLIEDNAQSIFAMENGKYAGTIGTAGVFSLNVHKHLQCGEGGVVVTNDDYLAKELRGFLNHGELLGQRPGLNLRMTEIQAAIALEQLGRADKIMEGRIRQAEVIIEAFRGYPGVELPTVRDGCTHVYYVVPFLVKKGSRRKIIEKASLAGLPLTAGYVEPLDTMPIFGHTGRPSMRCRQLHDHLLFYFSNCEFTLSKDYASRLRDIIQGIAL